MFSCDLDQGNHNRAFRDLILAEHGKDKFPGARFSLELKQGRWVHTPRLKKHSSLSKYYSFHLVDEFVGVKQA